VPRLLRLCDRYGLRTPWFVPEHSVETVPDRPRQILDSGHEVGCTEHGDAAGRSAVPVDLQLAAPARLDQLIARSAASPVVVAMADAAAATARSSLSSRLPEPGRE
jgi:hypothetical protein